MPQIGIPEVNYLAREYKQLMVCIEINVIAHKEKDEKIMASYIYHWIGQKGRDDLAGLMWREGEPCSSGKILMKKMKEL